MNYILFAGGWWAKLDGLCFILAVFCAYCIARHFADINHKSSGFQLSACVGMAIGILLMLDDYQLHPRPPQLQRVPIGFVGACLGYYLCWIQVIQKMKKDEQKTIDNKNYKNNENIDIISNQVKGSQQ